MSPNRSEQNSESNKYTEYPAALRANQIAGPKGILPIGLSTWWKGVQSGVYPPGIKLSPGVTVWRRDQIMALLDKTS